MHIGTVGAGLAGLSAGTELVKVGQTITMFDEGRSKRQTAAEGIL